MNVFLLRPRFRHRCGNKISRASQVSFVFSEHSSSSVTHRSGIKGCAFLLTVVMPQRQRLSDVDRGRAIGWLRDGVALREIGRRLQVTHSLIHRLRNRFRTTGSVRENHPGRQRITTRRQDRFVVQSCLRNRSATARTLRGNLLLQAM